MEPCSPDAVHRLGIAAYTSGDLEQARHLFYRLLQQEPHNPVAWSNHGVVCRAMGDLATAATSLLQALELCPDYPDAWNNLGAVYEKIDPALAMNCYRHALQLQPDLADACNNLALCYKRQQLFADAAEWHRRSLAIEPCQPVVWLRLAETLEQNNAIEAAREAYGRSLDLRPDDAVRLKRATLLPVIIPGNAEMARLRADLLAQLQVLSQQGLQIARPWESGRVLFYLAYHGQNDRLYHARMAAIYRQACPELTWQAPHVDKPRSGAKRIRIGFVSRFLYNHTIAKLNIGLVERLDRTRFHISVFLIDAGIRDEMTSRFETAADSFILLPNDFYAMRCQIAEQELDVLFYTDIGMEPFSYFLAFSRLAPLQCVTWGHPATSGIDTVDCFISHTACETEASYSSYTERLFCLSPASAPACYARLMFPESRRTRADFGLSDTAHLYYCPQPPFKLHPDFDHLLKGILTSDRLAMVVLLRGVASGAETSLQERFQRTMPELCHRIIFLDPLPYADYIKMLQLADLVLDTPHFSGGSSSVEALAVGTPVVTMPSAYLKGRLTAAWYQRIGVTECIAADPAAYVAIAVRLANDVCYRDGVRQRIKGAAHLLFDDLQAVRELEAFFETGLHEQKTVRHTLS